MGILDFLTGWAKKSGQQAYQNVTGQKPASGGGGTNTSRSPSPAPQQTKTRPKEVYVPKKGETPAHWSGDPTGANRPISNPTESMVSYPIYKIAKGIADTYKTNVTDRYAGFVEPRLQGRGAWEAVGQAGVGLVSSPGLALEFLGMIPAGAERLAREGARDISTVPMHAASGLVMQAEGISKGIKENPGRTVGELVGMGLVTHGAGKAAGASPIRPGIGRAVFPTESYTSLGIQTSRGGVVGFRPLIGLGKTAEGVHLTGGTPRIRIEAALGSERFTPATPLETRIVQGALGGEEAARISLARNIRTVTQTSGLSLRQASPIVQEVVKQHGIPNPQAVSKVITTALRDDGAQLYGSVIQRGIGQEAGKVGLSRVPRDFDIQVKSTTDFQKRIVTDINRAAGREVVAPEGKAGVLVKKTGEKLFDLHDMETAAAERQFTPKATSEYIAFGIKGENLVKTREGINTITLSEQATRKLEGSMQLRPTIESTHVDGSNLILSGRLLPKKPGRIKDIADYYFAEKLAIDVMKTSKNPVRVGRAIMAERNLDSFLGTWGSEVAGSVKVQYSRALTEGTLSVKLADYSTPPATATSSRFVPHAAASPNLYPSPAAATPSQSLSMTSPSMRAASEFARGSPSTMKYSPPRSPSPPTYNPSPSPSISPPTYSPPRPSPSPPRPPSPPTYSPPPSPPISPPTYSPPYRPPAASPPPSPAIYTPPYKIPSLKPPTTPPISRIQPSQNRLKLDDDRKIRQIRPDLSVRALDWTVKNPVPTFASVFGTGKAPKLDIKLPEFKL